jgi:UDP-N-acetylmuramoylalanine--D-glutamate ligase
MIAVREFQGKSVGVFGLARSGLSAARALQAGGAKLFAWDDNETARQAAAKEKIALEPLNRWPWQQIKTLVLSPGIPLTHPEPHPVVRQARDAGAEVIGDVELFARAVRSGHEAGGLARIIAVTGTNGKSTTTALIGHILHSAGLDAQIGGNIGKPVLDLGIPTAKTVYVLEVSSYQIELSPGLSPDVVVLTNLSPDHIDRHGSMENYVAVKGSLLKRAAPDGHVAVGVDDDYSASIYTKLVANRMTDAVAVSVGKVLGRGVFVIDGKLYDAWDQPSAQIGDLKTAAHLPGNHNWQNAALAYAAVRRLIRDPRSIFSSILRFPGLAHRIEDAGRVGKVRFVNDSKATNADAAARALACFPDVFWIAGGRAKEGGIADLEPFFPRMRKAYLIGEAAESFGKTLAGKVAAVQSGTLERALKAAFDDARASKAEEPVVLLSPACASFDQFKDFEHRGDVFKDLVRALIAAHAKPARAGAAS